MFKFYYIPSVIIGSMLAFQSFATTTEKPSFTPPSSVISTEHTLQMIGGLLIVLAVILGLTWLLKRFSLIPTTSSGSLKIVSATGVGQRERVVVVEIQDTWLVLGVAPGHISKLHTMNKPAEKLEKMKSDSDAHSEFSEHLAESINKNND
ncbi:MAG TPA: flagellar biosynthetic protein FliO [Nitrosomonas sp.]|nr:flagellar biosynthetic protein FliO [Nitrosomonas sp.]